MRINHSPELGVAIFDTHEDAASAVHELQRAGFDMKRLSIIGRDYHTDQHVIGYFNAGDRARFFGKYGAFWGGLAGMFFGAAFLFVPVFGHLVVLGPLAATVVGALQGAVIGGGVTAIAGALSALGVPKNSVLRYETAIKADKYLLVVHGDAKLQQQARDILGARASLETAAA
ncbi:MAG TPA: general stress protein [Burkholderiaceae bacterium]|nr:general stress protein [Burkholderiaceae bacterium]